MLYRCVSVAINVLAVEVSAVTNSVMSQETVERRSLLVVDAARCFYPSCEIRLACRRPRCLVLLKMLDTLPEGATNL